jgi:asparagine synthase (glutamine-hydrolysing)
MGFAVPIDQWLRGSLKEWAGDLLDPVSLRSAGLLEPEPITTKWAEHQTGARSWQHLLWNVLMFESWRCANAATADTRQTRATPYPSFS